MLNTLGDPARAAFRFTESLTMAQEIGETWTIALTLVGLAGVANAQGEPDRAAQIFGAAAPLFESAGMVMAPPTAPTMIVT
ncbi:MAG TPA: hypothetical protein VN178_15400 [Rubrobacter sp.]|nr:hypothetical protein [Rubrobacter sp.]